MVMQYSANNIGKKVKYVNIDRDVRSANLKEAFNKLEMSRIIHLVRHTNSRGVPLTNQVKEEIFKPLFLDIGLANHLGNIQLVDIQKLMTINEGALAEQFIGQEMLTLQRNYIDAKLYYWVREEKSANAEIDYIYQYKNRIFPIEVKAGKSGSLKSLHVYLFAKQLNLGIRFNIDMPNYGMLSAKVMAEKIKEELEYNLISLPLYMCFTLPKILEQFND